jgi:hypothetical protein
MLSYKLQKGHFQFFALVPTGVVGCLQVESMTRLVPRKVVMLRHLQRETACMLNAMLKECRHLFEVTTEFRNSFYIHSFRPSSTTDNAEGKFGLPPAWKVGYV